MTKIASINFATSVDTADLKAALTDLQEAVQNLDAKLTALNEVEIPVEVGIEKDSADRMAKAVLKTERIIAANKPSPSYRAADPQASEM